MTDTPSQWAEERMWGLHYAQRKKAAGHDAFAVYIDTVSNRLKEAFAEDDGVVFVVKENARELFADLIAPELEDVLVGALLSGLPGWPIRKINKLAVNIHSKLAKRGYTIVELEKVR